MRLTLITPYLPHSRIGHGGGVSIRNMIAYLARVHQLTVITLLRDGEEPLVRETAEDLGVEIRAIPFLDNHARGWKRLALYRERLGTAIGAIREGRPFYVRKYGSASLSKAVLRAVADSKPEAVQIEYFQLGLLTRDLRRWRDAQRAEGRPAPGLFTSSHELGSLPRSRRLAQTRNLWLRLGLKREISAWRRLERDVTLWADRTFCVTDQDRELLEAGGGVNCLTLPLGVDTESVKPVWEGRDSGEILFVGSFAHRPNRLAADQLLTSIWPALSESSRVSHLSLAGPGSREFLSAGYQARSDVQALGFVPDLNALYRRCRLLAAPLPEGGGIKIKILEAMAAGIPIVTTEVGAEGIATPEDEAMRIVHPGEDFKAALVDVLEDPETAACRALRARRLVEDRFSWSAITARLASEYARSPGR